MIPNRRATAQRATNETKIEVAVEPGVRAPIDVTTGLPFFDHILRSMGYHGRLGLTIRAEGDLQIDPHHTVEDVGIVLGTAFRTLQQQWPAIHRFGHAVVPMDDALSEATADLCNRPYLVYRVRYRQEWAGRFHLPVLREFFYGFVDGARCTIHLANRYGENGHHIAESLFKAFGMALGEALATVDESGAPSTKGML